MRSSIICILFFCTVNAFAQQKQVIYTIEENYDKPHFTLTQETDKFNKREVVDGMYIAKSLTVLGPELKFSHRINQFNCIYSSEMEFTLRKIKGGKDTFIGVLFTIHSEKDLNYPRFVFNSVGEWKLYKHMDIEKASGTTTVNEENNVLKVVFNKTYMEFYLNGNKVTEHKLYEPNKLEWKDIKIQGDKKTVIGLDKLVLTAYYDEQNPDIGEYEAERFMNGMSSLGFEKGFVLRQENGKYRFVSVRGWISEIEFDDYTSAYSGPLIRFEMKNPTRYGYVDKNAKLVYPSEFTYAESSPCYSSDCPKDFYMVKDKEGNTLFVNEKGEQKRQ